MGDVPQEGSISVRPLDVPGAGRAFPFGVQLAFVLLTLAALVTGALSFLLFWGAFWFVGESVRLALGASQPLSPAWPIVPAVLAAWGVLYLATDRLAMLGSATAQETLREKSRRFFAPWAPPERSCFVEARVVGAGKRAARMDLDLGILYLLPNRLLFVGDYYLLEVPREAIRGKPRRDRDRFGLDRFGLIASYVSLPLADGKVRLLCRDDAIRQSETAAHTRRLESTLVRWLSDEVYGDVTEAASHAPRTAER